MDVGPQPNDCERRLYSPSTSLPLSSTSSHSDLKLKIAIVVFGNFGQFLARTIAHHGHVVIANSRSDYSSVAVSIGVSFFPDIHDLCQEHPDVVVICTSILSTESVLKSIPLHLLPQSTLFVDVLSVKEFPRDLFLRTLPEGFDVLCTHPMFGPESGRDGWEGLPFVFDKVRVGEGKDRMERCNRFLGIFKKEGCKMVEMSCTEHDRQAAASQFLTHTVGRVLDELDLTVTSIGTKGYDSLLKLRDGVCKDSFDLYHGLFLYNKNSIKLLLNLEGAFDAVKRELFDKLHDRGRKQTCESQSIPADDINDKIGQGSRETCDFASTHLLVKGDENQRGA